MASLKDFLKVGSDGQLVHLPQNAFSPWGNEVRHNTWRLREWLGGTERLGHAGYEHCRTTGQHNQLHRLVWTLAKAERDALDEELRRNPSMKAAGDWLEARNATLEPIRVSPMLACVVPKSEYASRAVLHHDVWWSAEARAAALLLETAGDE